MATREPPKRSRSWYAVSDESLDDIIHRAVRDMVVRCGGNKSDAARRLGISRTRLQRVLARSTPEREASPSLHASSETQTA
jgi:ActR/RegA family two-component response regulator